MTYINFFQLSANEIKRFHYTSRAACDSNNSLRGWTVRYVDPRSWLQLTQQTQQVSDHLIHFIVS